MTLSIVEYWGVAGVAQPPPKYPLVEFPVAARLYLSRLKLAPGILAVVSVE